MNTTLNGTSCFTASNAVAEQIGKALVFCLILLVSLVGNSFLVVIVSKTQTMRKPINYLITNMAISDLL